MYDYNYSVKTFQNLKFLYMNRDSLMYEIREHDVYVQMKQDIHIFDTSDYPTDNTVQYTADCWTW